MNKKLERHFYPYYFILPALLFFTLFFFLPILMGGAISFTNWNIERDGIRFVGLANYLSIFKDRAFLDSIGHTFLFSIATTVGKMALGLLLAVALTQGLRGQNFFRTIFYMTSVMSYVVVGIVFTAVFQYNGMVNNLLRAVGFSGATDWIGSPQLAIWTVILLDVWMWTGLHMMIYIAGLQGIPADYYEAAQIDGASFYRRFRHISLPLLQPATKINLTLCLVGGFKVFEQVNVLTGGGPGRATMVVNLLVYQTFGSGRYGRATAIEFFLSLSIFVVTIFLNLYFSRREVEL